MATKTHGKHSKPTINKEGNAGKTTTTTASNPQFQKNLKLILGIVTGVFGILLYVNTFHHNYALDDVAVIKSNKFVQQGLAGIPTLLHTFYWQGYWNANAGLYRPLSMILFATEWQFFPYSPHIYHMVNVLLYGLMGFLLFTALSKVFNKVNLVFPFIVSLLFVAFPLHTEVVSNIKSADELLSFIFFLLTVNMLWTYFSTNNKSKLYLSVMFFFIALFAKESVVSYLLILPLMIYYFTNNDITKAIKAVIPFAIVTAVFLIIHTAVLASVGIPKITYTYLDNTLVAANNFMDKEATAMVMMGKYLTMLFIPYPMSYDYSFNEFPITNFADVKALASVVIYLALFAYAIINFKKKQLLSFCILFYLVTMSLVSNLFVLIGATFADRFLFVPSLGFCIAVGYLFTKLTKTYNLKKSFNSIGDFVSVNAKVMLPVAALLALYSFTTINRNKDWKDDFTLMTHDVNVSQNSSRTHYNNATEIMNVYAIPEENPDKKRILFDTVVKELERSLKLDSNSNQTYQNMSVAYYFHGDYAKSIEASKKVLSYDPNNDGMHLYLGKANFRNKDYASAIEHLNFAEQHGNKTSEVYSFLGGSYTMRLDYPKAIESYKKALMLTPNDAVTYSNLGGVYGNAGDFKSAIETFNKALELKPNDAQTLYYMAITYNGMGDKENAKKYMELSKAAQGHK